MYLEEERMNFERIILEMLERIGKLEDEVKALKGEKPSSSSNNAVFNQDIELGSRQESYTDKACLIIENAIRKSKQEGKEYIDVVSNDLQHAVGLKNRIPLCCNAMRKVAEHYRTEVIKDTPSHNSSTYTIRFYL